MTACNRSNLKVCRNSARAPVSACLSTGGAGGTVLRTSHRFSALSWPFREDSSFETFSESFLNISESLWEPLGPSPSVRYSSTCLQRSFISNCRREWFSAGKQVQGFCWGPSHKLYIERWGGPGRGQIVTEALRHARPATGTQNPEPRKSPQKTKKLPPWIPVAGRAFRNGSLSSYLLVHPCIPWKPFGLHNSFLNHLCVPRDVKGQWHFAQHNSHRIFGAGKGGHYERGLFTCGRFSFVFQSLGVL